VIFKVHDKGAETMKQQFADLFSKEPLEICDGDDAHQFGIKIGLKIRYLFYEKSELEVVEKLK